MMDTFYLIEFSKKQINLPAHIQRKILETAEFVLHKPTHDNKFFPPSGKFDPNDIIDIFLRLNKEKQKFIHLLLFSCAV